MPNETTLHQSLTIWMEDVACKLHLGGTERVVRREGQFCCKYTSFKTRLFRASVVGAESDIQLIFANVKDL